LRLLLDTHSVLWWASNHPALSATARKLIEPEKNIILVSPATAWEITTKFRLGKLPSGASLVNDFAGFLERYGFETLPITLDHAVRAGLLAGPHRDPCDRMLIAQAIAENIPIISSDVAFDSYTVRRLW
jgi:PIN domain nuclease of toxin-antitoxin system